MDLRIIWVDTEYRMGEKFLHRVDKLPVIFLLLVAGLCPVSAQNRADDSYVSRFLIISEGLPHSNVDGLYQDSKGFVWVSFFGGGLARYDGAAYVLFSSSSTPPQRLESNYVTETCEDGFDRMWVATTSGLELIDMKSLAVEREVPEFVEQTQGDYCNFIATDSLGCLWYNTYNVLYRVAFAPDGSVARRDSLVAPAAAVNMRLKFRDIDSDGTVWTSIDGNVCRVSYTEGRGLQAVSVFPIGEDNKAVDFLAKDNEVWVATNRGLFRFDRLSEQTRHYVHDSGDSGSIAHDQTTGLVMTPEGQVALGTMSGLSVYNPMTDGFQSYSAEANDFGDRILSDDIVRSLLVVRDELWVGTELEGITIMTRKRLHMTDIHHRENSVNSIPDTPVSAIATGGDGTLWLGSPKYGVFLLEGDCYDYSTRVFNTRNSALVSNSVSAFAFDGDGMLWIGTKTGGINVVDPAEPGRMRVLREAAPADDRIDNINCMVYDGLNGYMWICSRSGLFYYDFESSEFKGYGQVYVQCMSAEIDSDDRMWVGTQAGVLLVDLPTLKSLKYDDFGACFCVDVDDRGDVWLGSFGLGVWRLTLDGNEPASVSSQLYNTGNGLSDNRVRSVLAVSDYVYVATENGLSRIDASSGSVECFGLRDGLRSMIFSNAAAHSSQATGYRYFGHKEGLMVLLSDNVIPSPKYAGESEVRLVRGLASDREVNFAYEGTMHMHERDLALSFEFSDFAFGDSSQGIEYFYRIYPLDDEWREVRSANKFIRYDYPPGGRFSLQVRSCDLAGNVLSEDSREIVVKPYFWKTWWFFVLFVFVTGTAVMLITNLRTRSIQRQRETLRLEVQRQTRELAEQNSRLEKQAAELVEQNKRLLSLNEELASHKMVFNSGTVMAHPSRDEKFVEMLMDKMKEIYRDPEVDVESICRTVGMSRNVLNTRMQETFGMSIGQFLRTYRLNIAREILSGSKARDVNVSEVAYDVGFNDPKYFTRCFTREFKVTPSSLLRPDDEGAGK